jgi:hypothetical protein
LFQPPCFLWPPVHVGYYFLWRLAQSVFE